MVADYIFFWGWLSFFVWGIVLGGVIKWGLDKVFNYGRTRQRNIF